MVGVVLTNTVRVGARVATVEVATLELFNLFSQRPDWILDARLAGSMPRLWLAGTGEPAPYTRERRIDVAYIDAPALVTLDGRDGRIAPLAPGSLAALEIAPGQARVRGAFSVRWWASGEPARELAFELDLVAALVT